MDRDYAATYRHLYTHHWWWRARERAILQTLRERLPAGRRGRILDIGCGDGLWFDKLAAFGDVEGVEVCGDLISRQNPWRSSIHVGPFDETFNPRGHFSLILLLDVLEHLADPCAALRHVSRLLTPDGLVVIHVPALESLWTTHDDLNHHYTRYSRRTLQDVLRAASLWAESLRYTFYWTCPVKLAIRAKERLLRSVPRPPAVPAAPVNALCYGLCRVEQWLFTHRSPGFGTSLLAVARHGARRLPIAPAGDDAAGDDAAAADECLEDLLVG